jgi:hypothetical protein
VLLHEVLMLVAALCAQLAMFALALPSEIP